MATTYSQNKIVTDGLMYYLDPANYKSYTSGSTIMSDITNNYPTASFINDPIFDGNSIVLDGTDEGIQLPDIDTYTSSSKFTVCMFLKSNGGSGAVFTNGSYGNGFNGTSEKTAGLIISLITSGNVPRFRAWLNNDYYWTTSLSISNLSSNSYPCTIFVGFSVNLTGDGDLPTFFVNSWVNNSLYLDYFNTSTNKEATEVFQSNRIGIGNDGNAHLKANIYNVAMYDRILTEQEYRQNCNALKSRFNLP